MNATSGADKKGAVLYSGINTYLWATNTVMALISYNSGNADALNSTL